jgi:diacylglycerol kinase (ATP)
MLEFKQATLIYNPIARRLQKDCQKKVAAIKETVEGCGIHLEMAPTLRSLHATELTRQALAAGTQLIIACGGDGTLNEIIGGLAGSSVPMLILPGGTANVLAKDLNIPKGFLSSLTLLTQGKIQRITLGKANSRYFSVMIGVGVDAAIAAAAHPGVKKRVGQGAFWLAGIQQFFSYTYPVFEVHTPARTYRGTFAVIARARSYGGPIELVPQADLFSDRFDVCLFEKSGRLAYLRYIFFVFLRHHTRLPDVKCFSAESLKVTGPPETWAQADGELIGHPPLEISLERNALSLIIPS